MRRKGGWSFIYRGMASNMTAVAIPIAITIFMTDILVGLKERRREKALT